jgi:putative Holliday junction resolvase
MSAPLRTAAADGVAEPATASPAVSVSGTVLGFDFGGKRIGVAVGEHLLKLAHPLLTIESDNKQARFAAIDKLLAEWRPVHLVLGLPLAVDGSEHEMTRRARRFARQLEARYSLAVTLIDERYSSAAAEMHLREQGVDLRHDKAAIDAAAAQIILQEYFDAGH